MLHFKFLFLFLLIHINQSSAQNYNPLGGYKPIQADGKIYYHTKKINDIWWLIDPAGHGFISKGVNCISFRGDFSAEHKNHPYQVNNLEKHQTQDDWADATANRLKQWQFNTIGAWSSTALTNRKIPYTINLEIAKHYSLLYQNQLFPDVFSDKFERVVKRIARLECKPKQQDLFLIGYFTDHYLQWNYKLSNQSILESYLSQDSDTEGYKVAISFLQNKYITIDQLNKAWQTKIAGFSQINKAMPLQQSERREQDQKDFLYLVAHQYFNICHEYIKDYDPNHLILGNRINLDTPTPVIQAMKDFTDVVSINVYTQTVPEQQLTQIHDIINKPILISEFTYIPSENSQDTLNHDETFHETRALFFEQFVTDAIQLPFIIGYHWYQYTNKPVTKGQRQSNFGLVDIKDNPYKLMIDQVIKTNQKVEKIHQNAHHQK